MEPAAVSGTVTISDQRSYIKIEIYAAEIPQDLFRSFKVCSDAKERVGAESKVKLPHLFFPTESATLVPEFVVDNLSSAELRL